MSWIAYTLISIVLWAGWAFLGKLALRHADWVEISFTYGIAVVVLFGALLALPGRRALTAVSVAPLLGTAVCGALGLAAFYLALERQKASLVVPMITVYPAITAVLAIAFLGESLTAVQAAGVGCAVVGVVLLSLGR